MALTIISEAIGPVARQIDNVLDVAKAAENAGDAVKAVETTGDVVNAVDNAGGAARGAVALDANALIGGIEHGEMAALDAAIAGRQPLVSITATKEFLSRGDANALRNFLSDRGGRIGAAGSERAVAGLQDQAAGLGRNLRLKDARVAASAQREGVSVITRDSRFRNFLNAVGIGGEDF